MALITFLGGPDAGNVGEVEWGRFTFALNRPVECDDPHIVAKASGNRFFRVEPDAVEAPPEAVVKLDPLGKARAAKAAKRASEAGDDAA